MEKRKDFDVTKLTDKQLDGLTNNLKTINNDIATQLRNKLFFERMGVDYEPKYRSNYWDGVLYGIRNSNR